MKRLALGVLLLALCAPAAALAFGKAGGSLSTSCPLAWLYTDGCSGAPAANAYTVKHADMLTSYALQSGQTYNASALAARTRNSPAVEYSVGVNASKISAFATPGGASDPTVTANWNAVNNATGGSGGSGGANCHYFGPTRHYVLCNGTTSTGTLTIDGFDFSAAGNSVGAMSLEVASTVNIPCVITNNNFKFDANSYDIVLYPIKFSGCSSLTVKNNLVAIDAPPSWLGPTGSTAPSNNVYISWQNSSPSGPYTSRYNALIGCPTRCIQIAPAATTDIAYDYYEGLKVYSVAAPGSHGDGILSAFSNVTQALFSLKNTTWMQPAYGGSGNTGQATLVTNNPAAGGLTLTTTNGSAIISQSSGVTLTQNYFVTGSNVTSPNAWRIVGDGTTPANPPSAPPTTITMSAPATRTGSATYTEMLPADVALTDIQDNLFLSNNTNASSPDGPGLASLSFLLWAQYANYQTVKIGRNFLDPHGSLYCFAFLGYGVDPSPTFSGNINLNDNSSWNHWDTAAGTCPGSRAS